MSDHDHTGEDLPISKRRRCLGPRATTEPLDDTSVVYSDFWFRDGDIVLAIEHHRFKVHCSCLAKSSDIFSDMLQIPQPTQVDSIDGCPLVRLFDAPEDWTLTLRWMYDPTSFSGMPHPVPFTLIPGSLRIATKYEIPDLRRWAVHQLLARWPTEIERMDTNALPSAAGTSTPFAISLARECDVPEILPAAFYALALQRWRFNADGGDAHRVLAPRICGGYSSAASASRPCTRKFCSTRLSVDPSASATPCACHTLHATDVASHSCATGVTW
ncbi:hypothetical protein B0H21DRAFT_695439 [Amylocystis lapponica]|nr:hypothetical protein B0H21DRAFT_695439 [Amylocystis lapponica]